MEVGLARLAIVEEQLPPALQVAQHGRGTQTLYRWECCPGIAASHETHRFQVLEDLLRRLGHLQAARKLWKISSKAAASSGSSVCGLIIAAATASMGARPAAMSVAA